MCAMYTLCVLWRCWQLLTLRTLFREGWSVVNGRWGQPFLVVGGGSWVEG